MENSNNFNFFRLDLIKNEIGRNNKASIPWKQFISTTPHFGEFCYIFVGCSEVIDDFICRVIVAIFRNIGPDLNEVGLGGDRKTNLFHYLKTRSRLLLTRQFFDVGGESGGGGVELGTTCVEVVDADLEGFLKLV